MDNILSVDFIEGFEKAASNKLAFVGSVVKSGLKSGLRYVKKHPMKSAMGGLTVAFGASQVNSAMNDTSQAISNSRMQGQGINSAGPTF